MVVGDVLLSGARPPISPASLHGAYIHIIVSILMPAALAYVASLTSVLIPV